jgi:hypothetical protein
MYVGHIGIALGARSLRRDVPLWLLVLAAQGCDWLDVLFGQLLRVEDKSLWTHSIPSVAVGAVAIAVVALVLTRSRGAAVLVGCVWVSHVLVDYLTGYKPLFFDGRVFGLGLYARPAIDFALEAALIAIGWWMFRTSAPPARRGDPVLGALLVALLGLQLIADTAFAVRGALRARRGLPDDIARVEAMDPPPIGARRPPVGTQPDRRARQPALSRVADEAGALRRPIANLTTTGAGP